ncbi:MAG: oligosaccharide flippase family protein [Rubrivivax sp.]
MKAPSLKASAFWRLLEGAGSEILSFAGFIVLARLLVPEDFGAVALAGSVMQLIQVALYNGSLESLIQHPKFEPRHFHAACAANLAFAATLMVIGLALAWPLGWALHRPEFTWILSALLPTALLRAFMSPMLAVLRRQMDFRSIALRTLLAVTVAAVVAVVCAWQGMGEWSLVAQQWTNEVVGIVFLAWRSPLKPTLARGDRQALRELLPVAMPVMGAQLVTNASRKLDNLAIGSQLGDHVVGIYFMANRLVMAAQAVALNGPSELAMVVLSKSNAGGSGRWLMVSSIVRLAVWPSFIVLGTLSLLGPTIVPLLFGPAWLEASRPMAVLAALAPAGAMINGVGVALVARGSAAAYRRLAIAVAALLLGAIVAAAAHGIEAVVLAIGLVQCLSLPYALAQLRRAEALAWPPVLGRLGSLLLLHVAIFVPCALLAVFVPSLGWAAGLLFVGAAAGAGWVRLREDWARVSAFLADAAAGR